MGRFQPGITCFQGTLGMKLIITDLVHLSGLHFGPCRPRMFSDGVTLKSCSIREGAPSPVRQSVQDCTPGKPSDSVDNYRLTRSLAVKAIFLSGPEAPSRSASFTACYAPIFRDADFQPFLNQAQDALVRDTVLEKWDRSR
jgi:hypothetical protein